MMQDYPLVVPSILEYAARWQGTTEIVSINPEGDTSTSTYADLLVASRQCAAALRQLGVR